jgi:uncharacterized peroxidase-related enzyme
MSYLTGLSVDGDGDEVARFYQGDRDSLGYVANYTRLLARRPKVLDAWKQLNGAIKAGMDAKRYELATLGAARRLRSSYCSLAHGKVLATLMGEQPVLDLMNAEGPDPLDRADRAVVNLADKVAREPADISEADIQQARDAGLSDEEILDVVLAASARCFFSSVLEATGAAPDGEYNRLISPTLRAALTVGRPIETEA